MIKNLGTLAASSSGLVPAAVMILALGAAGCASNGLGVSETSQHGYVISDIAVEQVPVGSSKDQVLIALGSPSTTSNFSNEAYYYISQTRKQSVAFMPERVVDQRVLAIYFDDKDQVTRVADYGLKDGEVFDFVSRTTPTGGADDNFLRQVFTGVLGGRGN